MNLLQVNGVITPSESRTNISHGFEVPSDIHHLIVNYEYNPKTVEDELLAGKAIVDGLKEYDVTVANASSFLPVKNLVTLSFNENGRYRGACHRQPNKQTIIIGIKNSTFGIANGAVNKGFWEAVLNVHYAGCEINYTIDIEGVTFDEFSSM